MFSPKCSINIGGLKYREPALVGGLSKLGNLWHAGRVGDCKDIVGVPFLYTYIHRRNSIYTYIYTHIDINIDIGIGIL